VVDYYIYYFWWQGCGRISESNGFKGCDLGKS